LSSSRRARALLTLIIMFGVFSVYSWADEVQLKQNHPDRYTVVKGDTLWDIATRFLKSPWHWPRIWRINEAIKNPHLIYPGDVVVLRYVDGKPELTVLRNEKLSADGQPPDAAAAPTTVTTGPTRVASQGSSRLSPRVYSEPLERAIPTISPDIIVPFLTQPLAVGDNELERAGYVTIGLDDRIALGNRSEFYARGLADNQGEYFQIFRPGRPLRNPDTGELLAYEATYLGDAQLVDGGDPSKLVVTSVKQEILPTDRLLAAPRRAALPYYFPHAPGKPVTGRVISAVNSVEEVGPFSIVAVSVGQREGIEEGHVLRVMRDAGSHKDPITRSRYRLPDEESALLLVFRTYEKLSYALVMNATRPVHLLDAVTTP